MYRSLFLCFLLACGPDPAPDSEVPPGPPEPEPVVYPVLEELDELVLEAMEEGSVPGLSACIIRGDETPWCSGYGFADIEAGREVTPSTGFGLASVSKTVTGVALMHLVETGALGLDDPVNEHLDFEVQHPTDSTDITARMLLSHSAGIDDNWGAMLSVVVDGDSPIALGDFLEGYLSPGGEWYTVTNNFVSSGVLQEKHYSNIGVALAGYLVEAVSGVPFDDYCETHIFTPLGMDASAWHLADLDLDQLAVPYRWQDDDWSPVEHYGYPDYPDGALRSSAEDMATFLAMFASGGALGDTRILSEDSVATMQTVQYPELSSSQGLIWYTWNLDGVPFTGHNGGDVGISTQVGFRDDGVGFVILMNSGGTGGTLGTVERALLQAADSLPEGGS